MPRAPALPLIVNAAITGMVPRRERVPHVPLTAEQIVEDAVACHAAGAAIVHLHARDADERPAWRREAYEEFVGEIRRRCPELVLCVTTSGRTFPELERRMDVLALAGDAKPDMASLTLGSLNFRDGPSVNAIADIEALAARMAQAEIKPELEVFDLGMAQMAQRLLDRGLLGASPPYVNVLLGNVNTAPAHARALTAVLAELPAGAVWAAAGLGAAQLPVNGLAVFMGGHVRTGLEDNPHWDAHTREPATNTMLIERVAALAAIAGRPLATAAQTRALLGLAPVPAVAAP
jgi:3-keto-5-aminohexanoate cleavage enzyme